MLAEHGSDFPPAVDSAQLDLPAGHRKNAPLLFFHMTGDAIALPLAAQRA